MNDAWQKYIGWFLIILLFASYITINNIIFFKINQQESEDSISVLTEKIDELRMLLEVNQSRVEKRMFDLKRNLHTQCEQGDSSLRHKNLAKLLLLVVKMKNSLLREVKFDNHINSIKPLISELDDPEIENAVNELENLKEVDTLHELKLSFEKNITVINYNKSTLFKKIISNWIKIDNQNDPLKVKLAEIEESISDNDWQSIATTIGDLTHPEFKPWLNKLNNFIVAFKNTSTIYHHLLQYIS
ncbi:hypothetical protein HGO53_02725 [Wolbachia endosymbiont of Diaphorina citri]|jgi:hypothetical protein|uniref:hypothetical protein n=1 Tax=Wolbachia endosymbiont of Diaphorina citri TaxID=116598 RepID=UPI00031E9C41|nr:hypothetical protein [Wolbachia endosymbiont of Diaphorina citri]QJT94239.1 hypothetical protein HGO48_02015 [Wolbachia endosymbiont of Diaphorina citri]QJT95480.1 hypothetical protein HGO49_02015 [Wolbachia endosymbiont of Diaphorina citri]QJT96841.1 hypothetical protein HGO53_02725 [Wolbachia endosymbiont of Diaphorina citri]QLK11136.1 hypothetical protein FK497_02055 [Wolbachia endosymbiont of Diaphorina citri]QXY87332.1 hypothetical protein GZ064_05725 [Wolbachia endosymbiont of Diaphor